MRARALAAAALVALAVCPVAAAHGDGAARGFRSTVTAIAPAVPGLAVEVLGGDDQLRLGNESGRAIVVRGYDGEPYLRFAADGTVFRNADSPATYLNEERYGAVQVPSSASAKAPPRWIRVARGGTYEWHDHRIHWMSTIDPPLVRGAPGEAHHVFDWTVPATADGKRVAIRGSLDYEPPPASSFDPLLIAPLAALALAGALFWWARRRGGPEGGGRAD